MSGRPSPFPKQQKDFIESFYPALLTVHHGKSDVTLEKWKEETLETIMESPLFKGKLPSKEEDPQKWCYFEDVEAEDSEEVHELFGSPFIGGALCSEDVAFVHPPHGHSFVCTPPLGYDPCLSSPESSRNWSQIECEMWDGLEETERTLYLTEAGEMPSGIESFRNQVDFDRAMTHALTDVSRNGKLGGAVELMLFYAFRDPRGNLKTGTTDNWQTDFETPWKTFADQVIPCKSSLDVGELSSHAIPRNSQGIPIFPIIDLKQVTPNELSGIIDQYLTKLWACSWDATAPKWDEIFRDPDVYYDTSKFSLPVPLQTPGLLGASEAYMLAEYFSQKRSEPFVFRCKDGQAPEAPPSTEESGGELVCDKDMKHHDAGQETSRAFGGDSGFANPKIVTPRKPRGGERSLPTSVPVEGSEEVSQGRTKRRRINQDQDAINLEVVKPRLNRKETKKVSKPSLDKNHHRKPTFFYEVVDHIFERLGENLKYASSTGRMLGPVLETLLINTATMTVNTTLGFIAHLDKHQACLITNFFPPAERYSGAESWCPLSLRWACKGTIEEWWPLFGFFAVDFVLDSTPMAHMLCSDGRICLVCRIAAWKLDIGRVSADGDTLAVLPAECYTVARNLGVCRVSAGRARGRLMNGGRSSARVDTRRRSSLRGCLQNVAAARNLGVHRVSVGRARGRLRNGGRSSISFCLQNVTVARNLGVYRVRWARKGTIEEWWPPLNVTVARNLGVHRVSAGRARGRLRNGGRSSISFCLQNVTVARNLGVRRASIGRARGRLRNGGRSLTLHGGAESSLRWACKGMIAERRSLRVYLISLETLPHATSP
ncbi:hypothetical protein K438DRAFT_1749628 [Mycena galopus ATCC 62051]|nr:hypothetical protein K438DRAFT_1749628 [Mycena galopus ATCC 62051]